MAVGFIYELLLCAILWLSPACITASSASAPAVLTTTRKQSSVIPWRRMVAGGLAGSFSTCVLFPLDTVKTIRQSGGVAKGWSTLRVLLTSKKSLYSGLLPAVVGSFASSSIYFGSYETAKSLLFASAAATSRLSRPTIHMLAAASGNLASSFVFVPKDVLKQQMQAAASDTLAGGGKKLAQVIKRIYQSQGQPSLANLWGLKGFYPSYRATLLRNIPGAVLRFTAYEELRLVVRAWGLNQGQGTGTGTGTRGGQRGLSPQLVARLEKVGFLVAGAVASALASTLTTPLDVVKTRLATGQIAAGTPILACLRGIVRADGARGLFVGVQERLLLSGLFGGVGLASFEIFKQYLENLESDQQGGATGRVVAVQRSGPG